MGNNKEYYEKQLALLGNGPYKIIIIDEIGNKTKDLGVNPDSMSAFFEWATLHLRIVTPEEPKLDISNNFIDVFNKELESFSGLEESEKIKKQILLIATAIGVISKKIEQSNSFENRYSGTQTPIERLRNTLTPFMNLAELLANYEVVELPFSSNAKNFEIKNNLFKSLIEKCSKHKDEIIFYLADCEQFYNTQK